MVESVSGECLCGALLGAGDELPPQRGEVALLAGRREGFGQGASSWSLGLQLGDLEPDSREYRFTTEAATDDYLHYCLICQLFSSINLSIK